MFSGIFDKKPLVKAASTPLQPTSATQFKAHHGERGGLQAYLANLGNRIDLAKGQTTARPPRRWQQHNCLPWRNDHCNTCSNAGFTNCYPATTSQTSIVQSQRFVSHSSSLTNRSSRQLSSFDTDTADIYDASFVRPRMQRAPDSGISLTPTNNVKAVEQCLKDYLWLWFLEGGTAVTENERRGQALCILNEQLQAPIVLTVPSPDIYSCEEFQRIKDVVERCLEPMCIKGISLVPEIGGDGRELYVHVFED
jgi:hypothetical protein